MANTVTIELCTGYPFTDNSNVFDYAINNHKIDQFVEQYVAEDVGNPFEVADVDLTGGSVRLKYTFNTATKFNYMRISRGGLKWYAFITEIEYENNLNTTTFHFTLDVWNTYRSRFHFKKSFIEREHVANDAKFTHLLDEGFTPSQYYTQSKVDMPLDNYTKVLALSDSSLFSNSTGTGYPSNMFPTVYQCGKNQYSPLLVRASSGIYGDVIAKLIQSYTDAGKSDAIIGVFLLPSTVANTLITNEVYYAFINDGSLNPDDKGKPTFLGSKCFISADVTTNASESTQTILPPNSIMSYTPKNNKCFNYPFCFVQITNHLGATLDLHFERSIATNNVISIGYRADYSINGSYYVYARNYDGYSGVNSDMVLCTMNYPTVPYTMDSYSAWYGANQNVLANQEMTLSKDYEFSMSQAYAETSIAEDAIGLNSAMSVLNNFANPVSNLNTLANYAMSKQTLYRQAELKLNTLNYNYEKGLNAFKASLADKALMPTKVCGVNAPNALLANDTNNFTYKVLVPSRDEIESIDNYFTKYGYKVNTFNTLVYNRPRFDFKKMTDCNIIGSLPTNVINTLRGLFQQGITIWHDAEHIFDYSGNDAGGTPPQPPT